MSDTPRTKTSGIIISFATFHKTMQKQGTMKIKNVCLEVQEMMEMTGFSKFMAVD